MIPSTASRRTLSPRGPYTFDEFCQMVREDQKADLLDGVIYMASPDNTDAGELFIWLIRLMGGFVEEHEIGKVYGSRVAFRLSDTYAPEQDIAFVRTLRHRIIERGSVKGAPDLAMEIVSPDSVDRDYDTKRKAYERYGVEEYWIIDEMEERIHLLRLDRDGKYKEVRPRKGMLTSR